MACRALLRAASFLAPVAFVVVLSAASPKPVAAEAPVDDTPPSGTLTINDGSGVTNDPHLTLHVPATDDVGVVSIQVKEGATFHDPVPYADTIAYTLDDATPGVEHWLQVQWFDAAGNGMWSDGVSMTIDLTPPSIGTISFLDESPETDAVRSVSIASADVWDPLAEVRLSSDGTTWTPAMPWADSMPWHYLDPNRGGSPVLGPRTLYVQASDKAGNWSTTATTTLLAAPGAPLGYSASPKTGHAITITPHFPAPVIIPAASQCMWEIEWGDNASIYDANHDDTFGFFNLSGLASDGFCNPFTFTVPWMPYPQIVVHYDLRFPDSEDGIDEWIGSSPTDPAIKPAIDSTDRHITSSSLPLIYVLPDSYNLALGQPTTYRAYAVHGATFSDQDTWLADLPSDTGDLFQQGGTAFTFTPEELGFVTVCLNSDTSVVKRWSACYDPPVRHPDTTRPNTTRPMTQIGTATVGTTVPTSITWGGSDTGWGIGSYQLERSTDGGPWKRIASPIMKTFDHTLAAGHAYRYRVRAVDKAGNTGAWDVGATIRAQVVADGASAVAYAGTWKSASDKTATGGRLHQSHARNAKATFTFKGRDVAWVAKRGPGFGVASVYLDGKRVGTVDLGASAASPRRIVFRHHWTGVGTHHLRIVVAATATRPTVDVDGFLVLR